MRNVGFMAPGSELELAQQESQRQRALADALRQQSMTPSQGVQAGQMYIPPSWTQGLARMLQAYQSNKIGEKADEGLRTARGNYDAKSQADVDNFLKAFKGAPAETIQPLTPNDDDGNPMPVAEKPAVQADPNAALRIAMQSQNPMIQQAGGSILSSMMPKSAKWEKVEKPNPDGSKQVGFVDINSADPWSTFKAGGTAPVKLEAVNTGGGTSFVNPYAPDPKAAPVVPATGNKFKDLVVEGPGGALVPNAPLAAVKRDISKAGASNVNVKTDVKMGESLGAQVGPMMKDSTSIAEGAVKQVDAAQRIVKAIEGDKAFAGPLSNTRLKIAQVGQMLGIGGKNDAEKIANTRAAMRGMAELTLQGRQQMKGQGAITESEGLLAEKAMSGNIEDLTAAEILQLAKASERAARFNYGEHKRKLDVMQKNPALQGIAPFYEGPAMPAEATAPPSAAPSGFKIIGVK